jgi:hypothetical protein
MHILLLLFRQIQVLSGLELPTEKNDLISHF